MQRIIKRLLSTILWWAWKFDLNRLTYDGGVANATGRHYTREFLRKHASKCRGKFLEFGDPYWKEIFDPASITVYDVINPQPGDGVTVLGDIQNCPQIPDET